ncbi:MAG TPA: NAD(P)H-dependent oxidoreductase [Solirubrobacterales bacterium]
MRVLAIPGSVRAGSLNARLLRHVAEQAPAGVDVELYGGLKSIPPYDEDDDTDAPPAEVAALREAIERADAILIATPEYNHSIPGILKNALDWASRPHTTSTLRNKPVAVTGASTGRFGAVWAQAEARKVLGATGARVIDTEAVAIALAHDAFDAKGRLTTTDHEVGLLRILDDLASEVERDARVPVPA